MKRIIQVAAILGETVGLPLVLATPVLAQTATPSAGVIVDVPETTISALPAAGTASTTIYLVVFGVVVVLAGAILSLRAARSQVKVKT